MFLSDWRILLRRWYVVVAGLVVTAGLCVAAATLVPPHYEVKTSVVLLPGPTTVGKGGNPYLSLGNLEGVAAILARAMSDGAVTQKLLKQGASKDYLVATDPTTAGPVLLITSDAKTAADSLKTRELILKELPVRLSVLQESAQVPTRSLISLSTLSQDEQPTMVRKSQIRALFLAFALGICTTLGCAALLDGWLRRKDPDAAPDMVVPEAIYPPRNELGAYGLPDATPAPPPLHAPPRTPARPMRTPTVAPDVRRAAQPESSRPSLSGPEVDVPAAQSPTLRVPRLLPSRPAATRAEAGPPPPAPPTAPNGYSRIGQAKPARDEADDDAPVTPPLLLRGLPKRDVG